MKHFIVTAVCVLLLNIIAAVVAVYSGPNEWSTPWSSKDDKYLNSSCVQDQRAFVPDLESRIATIRDKYAERYDKNPRDFKTHSRKITFKNAKVI